MADSPAAEHVLDEQGVRALLRAGAPDLDDLPLQLVSEGWDNATWRLGRELAVRIPRRALAAPLIAHEHRALPELAPRLADVGVLTPVPIVAGMPSADFPWPWSVVPWIDGRDALGESRASAVRLAPALARCLLALHRPAPIDAPSNPLRGVPLRLRDPAMRERLQMPGTPAAIDDAWRAGLDAGLSTEHVWVHGDLHPGNILVDDGGLVALIDFGDVTAGDPAYDLAVSWLLFDAAGREAFRRETDGRYDDSTWLRARGWAAYIALVLSTQSDDRPALAALGRSTAEELALPR